MPGITRSSIFRSIHSVCSCYSAAQNACSRIVLRGGTMQLRLSTSSKDIVRRSAHSRVSNLFWRDDAPVNSLP
jgi:hypothetical protein